MVLDPILIEIKSFYHKKFFVPAGDRTHKRWQYDTQYELLLLERDNRKFEILNQLFRATVFLLSG